MREMRKWVALVLAAALALGALPAAGEDSFAAALEARFARPEIGCRTEVRWWMAEGAHTDETLLEEVQAMYDAGFRGMELCEQVDTAVADTDYGYGSDQWDHDLKLVLNRALDLGMTVSLTSGTNWATANIPGLDPQSQAASQMVFSVEEYLKAGKVKDGPVPMQKKIGAKVLKVLDTARLVGVFAYRQTSGNKASPIRFDADYVDLTDQVVKGEDGSLTLAFTPPDPESPWRIFYYWQQGAEQTSAPAVAPAYCINYFDRAGVEALKAYWEAHILDDPALNEKMKAGDVQLFMDSLEINPGNGFILWSEDMEAEFLARKGYDIRPWLYLFVDLPELWFWDSVSFGSYSIEGDDNLRLRIQNDLHDVQTQLYMERMLQPLQAWLRDYGITTRAQISYGQRLEISEPIAAVDFPEAENLNQNNQVDIYRLWTGGAKLLNKVLSSETGAVGGYRYTYQDHLMEAYTLFAAGFNRIIWHVWSAKYGPGENPVWPGYRVPGMPFSSFYTFGASEPSAVDYPVFNRHLGRVQKFLQTGVSRTDIGMLYQRWDQTMPTNGNQGGVNWMLNHEPVLFPSTALQDAGYTWDYLSPRFLTAEGVSFDPDRRTLEQAGYQALVLWQEWLSAEDAGAVLSLAQQGLPVVVVEGAAVQTPFRDGKDGELADVMAQLTALPCVRRAADADAVPGLLSELGVTPYAGFSEPNHQLLTQTRADDEALYLYVYNYCDGSYQGVWSQGEKQDDHGDSITTQMVAKGTFIPYRIDPWSGKATPLGLYRHEDGKTLFPLTLDYGDIALYVLRKCEGEAPLHALDSDAALVLDAGGAPVFRFTQAGAHTAALSDGREITLEAQVPEARDITGWHAQISTWAPAGTVSTRTETLNGKTITETAADTTVTTVELDLETLTTWDRLPEVGDRAVGTAVYTASFDWDGRADGAYLDFGPLTESLTVTVNGQPADDVSMTRAVIDIGPLLQPGENTIELHYASNLSNALGGGVPRGWYGYRTGTHPYGPARALLIPYVEIPADSAP
ncbi:MAG: hypothetical protein IKH77_08660 [Clostridia bacterium]|nr:hypothetical protein [Clostridia bacterium]